MKVYPLSEGMFTIDGTKEFVPFDPDKDVLQERPRGSLLVEIQPFVVVLDNDVLLLDTGLGFYNSEELQIHQNLKKLGVEPEQVTKVLLSHLHKDHAGGIQNNGVLNFPNAQYYVFKRELDFALEKGAPSYDVNEFSILVDHPQLTLLESDTGNINENIRYEMNGGHCPYHISFWITFGSETVFFGGDVAPQLQQMRYKYMAKYDFDGRKSIEWREKWWTEGREEGWQFLFYHDIKTPIFKQD